MATALTVLINMTAISAKPFAYVERGPSATGPWTRVGRVDLVNYRGYFYDNTVPYDTPTWYRGVIVTDDGTQVTNGIVTGPLTLVGTGNVVLSDPLRPWADIEFGFCASAQALTAAACSPSGPEFVWARFGGRSRRADVGLFDRLDSETPADVYARRKNFDSSARFLTKTLDAIDRVYELFTAGGPLFLRAPAAYGRTDYWMQPQDLADDYLSETVDQRFPHRIWTFSYTVVDPALVIQQGTACANWCAVADAFPTFAALTATGNTWAAVAAGTTVCP